MTLHAPQILATIPHPNSANEPAGTQSCNPGQTIRRPFLAQLRSEESGQDLIEYALAAALIGLSAVSSMNGLAANIANAVDGVSNALANAVSTGAAPPATGPSTPPSPPPGGHHHHDHD